MARKKVHKGSSINVRVPARTRFGAELLSHKYGTAMSAIVNRAIEMLMEEEGLTSRKKGEMLSLLDRLWDESEFKRLANLKQIAPELLSSENEQVLNEVYHQTEGAPSLTLDQLDKEVEAVRKAFSEF